MEDTEAGFGILRLSAAIRLSFPLGTLLPSVTDAAKRYRSAHRMEPGVRHCWQGSLCDGSCLSWRDEGEPGGGSIAEPSPRIGDTPRSLTPPGQGSRHGRSGRRQGPSPSHVTTHAGCQPLLLLVEQRPSRRDQDLRPNEALPMLSRLPIARTLTDELTKYRGICKTQRHRGYGYLVVGARAGQGFGRQESGDTLDEGGSNG